MTESEVGLLLVFAHPDDEVTWAGATAARYAAAGVRVALVTATFGEAGDLPAGVTRDELARVRARELRCAARALGIGSLRILGYPDGRLGELDEPVVAALARLLGRRRPRATVTFGPEGGDGHRDHVAIGRFTSAAWRLAKLPDDASLYHAVPLGSAGEGTIVVGDAAAVDAKLRAAACHRSQPSCERDLTRESASTSRETFRRVYGPERASAHDDPLQLL